MSKRPYQIIGEQLKELIIEGSYEIGDKLPTERDIAERMSVSRATVRDALIMLELEDLIEIRKGSGIYLLKSPQHTVNTGFLADNIVTLDIGPFEMLQARQLIEGHIAGFAAGQITKNDIARMEEALRLEKHCLDTNIDNEDGDRLFHIAIAEATQNSALVNTVNMLWKQRENSRMWKKLHSHITDNSYRQQWLHEHEAIFVALKKKDANEARAAMWQHLENVKQILLKLVDVDDPNFDGYLFKAYPLKSSTQVE